MLYIDIDQDVPPFAIPYLTNKDASNLNETNLKECQKFTEIFNELTDELNLEKDKDVNWYLEVHWTNKPEYKEKPHSLIWNNAGDYYETKVIINNLPDKLFVQPIRDKLIEILRSH